MLAVTGDSAKSSGDWTMFSTPRLMGCNDLAASAGCGTSAVAKSRAAVAIFMVREFTAFPSLTADTAEVSGRRNLRPGV